MPSTSSVLGTLAPRRPGRPRKTPAAAATTASAALSSSASTSRTHQQPSASSSSPSARGSGQASSSSCGTRFNAIQLSDDETSSASSSPGLPTVEELLAEHTSRATATTTSHQSGSSQGDISANEAAAPPADRTRRFAQSFPTFSPPQEAGGISSDGQARRPRRSVQRLDSTSTSAQRPQGSNASGSRNAVSSSSSSTQRPLASASTTTGRARPPSPPPTHTGENSTDDELLCAIIERQGLNWPVVCLEYAASSSATRTEDDLRQQWFSLTRRADRAPYTVAAMNAVADAPRGNTFNSNHWKEEELKVLIRGVAKGKTPKEIHADYLAKFPTSRRTYVAFKKKYEAVKTASAANEAGGDQDDHEDSGCESQDEASGSDEERTLREGGGAPSWSERDDRLLKLTVEKCRRGGHIDWDRAPAAFNNATKTHRTKSAMRTRLHFLKRVDCSAITTAGLHAPPAKKPAMVGRRSARTRWTKKEVRVLRQILARHSDDLGSYSKVWDRFYEAMPGSTRTPIALIRKWRQIVNAGGGVVVEGEDEEDSEDEGEQDGVGGDEEEEEQGDGEGDAAMVEPSVGLAPPSSTMQTRSGRRLLSLDTAQTWDVQPDEGQTDDSPSPSGSMDMGADLDMQPTDEQWLFTPPPAAEEQQVQPPAASASTSPRPVPSSSSAAAHLSTPLSTPSATPATAAAAASLSAASSSSLVPPSTFNFSSTREGIRLNGCFPGLEVLVFSGAKAQIFPHASAVPVFAQPPLLHLRFVGGGDVQPIRMSQEVSIRMGSASETTFVVEGTFCVVLVS